MIFPRYFNGVLKNTALKKPPLRRRMSAKVDTTNQTLRVSDFTVATFVTSVLAVFQQPLKTGPVIGLIVAVVFASVLSMQARATGVDQGATVKADNLLLDDGWVRAVPPVSANSAGYFRLINQGNKAYTLIGVFTPMAEAGELHETITRQDGSRSMRRLSEVIVEGGKTVLFQPGGKHLMLFRLTRPLQSGESGSVCLEFVERPKLCSTFSIR